MDKNSFKPKQWLTDGAVHFACQYEAAVVKIWKEHHHRVYLGGREYQSIETHLGNNSKVESILMKWRMKVLNCDVIFIPLRVDQCHWVCICHIRNSNTTVILDSLQNQERFQRLKEDPILAKLCLMADGGVIERRVVVQGACPQQKNGYDCGMMVIANFKFIANNTYKFMRERSAKYPVKAMSKQRQKYKQLFRKNVQSTRVELVNDTVELFNDTAPDAWKAWTAFIHRGLFFMPLRIMFDPIEAKQDGNGLHKSIALGRGLSLKSFGYVSVYGGQRGYPGRHPG